MDWMEQRKAALKRDYESVTGRSWKHFFCPILYRDEETDLCRAHIVNEAFIDGDRSQTIQRSDVDNHYGTLFESDFLDVQWVDRPVANKALKDRNLRQKLALRLLSDDKVQQHYFPPSNSSVNREIHTPIELNVDGETIPLALKQPRGEVEQKLEGRWEFRVEKDASLAAVVSLLKSAHLTLFHLLGYKYVFSPGGQLLGRNALGEFFLNTYNTQGLSRKCALEIAKRHFSPYASTVRPMTAQFLDLQGTISDGQFLACGTGDPPWGLGVLIWCGGRMHTVIVPNIEDDESAALFSRFLDSPFPEIVGRVGKIREGKWEICPDFFNFRWPQATL